MRNVREPHSGSQRDVLKVRNLRRHERLLVTDYRRFAMVCVPLRRLRRDTGVVAAAELAPST